MRPLTGDAPYLRVDIHDSDIATIDYYPTGVGTGRLFLGYEPAHYFQDPHASQPIDTNAEVLGLVAWAKQVAGVTLSPDRVMPLLANPEGAEPSDVFVEDTVVKLLRLTGLPLPALLQPDV
jgi:hypothetical protein